MFCHHKRDVCLRMGLTEKRELREAERKTGVLVTLPKPLDEDVPEVPLPWDLLVIYLSK